MKKIFLKICVVVSMCLLGFDGMADSSQNYVYSVDSKNIVTDDMWHGAVLGDLYWCDNSGGHFRNTLVNESVDNWFLADCKFKGKGTDCLISPTSKDSMEDYFSLTGFCRIDYSSLKGQCTTGSSGTIPGEWVGYNGNTFVPLTEACKCPENSKLNKSYHCECNKGYQAVGSACVQTKKQECEKTEGNKWENEQCKTPARQECEKINGTWDDGFGMCQCPDNYYSVVSAGEKSYEQKCVEKKAGESCSKNDLAGAGAASGTYNSNLKCVASECVAGAYKVEKNGVYQGWCKYGQPGQNASDATGGTSGKWWTMLVGSIK